jgi:hypothetical protein
LTYLSDGQTQTPVSATVQVAPQQRRNVAVPMPTQNPDVVSTFGTFLRSDQPIVVERALYWNVNGEVWAAGTNAMATRIRLP